MQMAIVARASLLAADIPHGAFVVTFTAFSVLLRYPVLNQDRGL